MSTASKRLLNPAEYLEQERAAPFRSEYFRGEVFAMAGASFEHTLVKDNFAGETRNSLRDGPCRVLTSDMRVHIPATGLYTYPDIAIVCDEPKFADDVFDTLLNPLVLIEVLSDSTEKYDRGTKFAHYRQIESLKEYVLVSQDHPIVERFVRDEKGTWSLTDARGLDAVFEFESVPVRVPLSEIYRGVTFPEISPQESLGPMRDWKG